MCGIAGFAGWKVNENEARALVRRMCSAIEHRGPDDDGYHVAPGISLGMRRLSIIDVAGGHQPISNEAGDLQVVFNGEIYNHRDLRRGLSAKGHSFATRSDTETIVHLYEDHELEFVHPLRGMFGIALWDESRQRLVLARDRLGIKPLYYWETPGGVAFASELRCFLALERFRPRLDRLAVARYLALGYVPDPLSIFEGVRKLPPGHLLTWQPQTGIQIERYWTPVATETTELDEATAVTELQRLLDESVSLHLESDVPLGAFLSGGIDSSTVVAYMARHMDQPVRTFSIGFEEAGYNEAPDAAKVAHALGTQHTELILRPDSDRLTEEVVRVFDEPFADSSALPTLLVSQLARRDVTVVLSGDGGDELFGGYTRYAASERQLGVKPAALRDALGMVARSLPNAAFGRNRLLDLSRDRRGRYTAQVATPLAAREGGVASEDLAAHGGRFEQLLDHLFNEVSDRDFPTQMMVVDLMSYLPGDILTKVDRASMASSLEARVPLLDHRLVEFAVSVPSRLKLRNGTGKWLLRRAAEAVVPAFVFQKPKKGFSLPLGAWFRKELRHRLDTLLRPSSPIYEYVERSAVRRLVMEHRFGRRDHSSMLWRLVVLDLWIGFLESGELGQPAYVSSDLAEVLL